MLTNKKILIAPLLFLLVKFALATVPASVDHSTLSLGQSLTLTIQLPSFSDRPNIDVLKNNFDVYGSSTSSQTNIINGHISSQSTQTVNLVPKYPGQQLIPAIKVGSDTTAPIQIEVLPPSKEEIALKNKEVNLEASIASQSSYVGVPVVYSVKLYYSVPIANLNMSQIDMKNAQIQPLGKDMQYQANVKGNNYHVVEQQFLITPSQSGDINIPSVKISGVITDNQTNNFFAMMQPKPFTATSKPILLHVKAVPSGITPDSWLPAKQLSLSESWSVTSESLKVGQAITRTISLQALGIQASSIPEINFPTPNGVNAYPDKSTSSNYTAGNNLAANKTFKIAYVATQAGSIVFPEVKVNWWDITTNSAKIAVIPAKTYMVLSDGGEVPSNQTPALTASASKMPGVNSKQQQTNTAWYYLAIGMAILWLVTILIVIIFFRKKTKKSILIQNNDMAIEMPLNKKKALNAVNVACQTKNLKALNLALINFAALYWEKHIYTVSDISDLTVSSKLRELIDKLNLALYKGYLFEDFAILQQEINNLAKSQQANKKQLLKDLYPK